MKRRAIKVLIFFFVTGFIMLLEAELRSSSQGITGLTKKEQTAIGCICHGQHAPSPAVNVWFSGPDSLAVGQTALYKIFITGGPAVTGGFDVASYADTASLNKLPQDTSIRKDYQNGELTHTIDKPFTGDTVFWSFNYTAPGTPQTDTLYAVGNSTNNDNEADTLDIWNFSQNFPVKVYLPIGIIANQSAASSFYLGQNYPNPFNSVTSFKFQVSGTSEVRILVYDSIGRVVAVLVDEKLTAGTYRAQFDGAGFASGVYFYRMEVSNERVKAASSESRKIVLIK